MENRELEFKEAVLVAVKVMAAICFPHVRSQSSIMAGELETAVQRIHHLVSIEREPVLPEKPSATTPKSEMSMDCRLGRQALSMMVTTGYVYCQLRECRMPATRLIEGLPFCEKHRADVALEMANNLGFLKPLPHESSTR